MKAHKKYIHKLNASRENFSKVRRDEKSACQAAVKYKDQFEKNE